MIYDSIYGDHVDTLESRNMTLGQLIDKLFQFHESLPVFFIGSVNSPSGLSSYRGSYDELALNYDFSLVDEGQTKIMTVRDFHTMLLNIVGKSLPGYKGGYYMMTRETIVWAAKDRSVTSKLMVVDVVEIGKVVNIVTLKL